MSKKVSTLKYSGTSGYPWLRLSIAVVACSLILSLANRFSNQLTSQVHTAHAVERRSVEPKKYYPSPNTIRGEETVAGPAVLVTVCLYPCVVSVKPLPVRVHLDDSLYNRPPPPFGFIL